MSVRVSDAVWRHSAAEGSALLVLLALADFADHGGVAFPSREGIAAKCRMDARHVRRAIIALTALGELAVEQNTGRRNTNVYRILIGTKRGAPTSPFMPPKGDTATPLSDAERVTNLTVKGDKSDRKGGRRCHPNRINRHEPSLIGVPRVRARNTTHERAALPSHQQIVDAFNAEEGLRKLARVDVVNDKRKRDVAAFARFAADRVAKRAADRGDVEPPSADETLRWVRLYFAKAGRDDFLAGRANGGPGHESWRPTFDFLIAQRTWPRVIEAPSGDGGAHAPIAEFQ